LDEYSAGIAKAEQYARGKPYIEAVTLFTAGFESPWSGFDHDDTTMRRIAADIRALPAPSEPAPTPPPQTTGIPMDGRFFSREEFGAFVQTLDLRSVKRVVVHHTASPDEETWTKWGGWEYWKHVLKRYYESKGWTKGPHLFVCADGIGVFYDLEKDGRGVGGGSWENGSRHVEIVGNFMDHVPTGERRKNAIEAIVQPLVGAGLAVTPETVTHHTAVVGKGVTACPGAAMIAHWQAFYQEVARRQEELWTPNAAVLEELERHVIPQVPGHALYNYITGQGWTLASREVQIDGWWYQCGLDAATGERVWVRTQPPSWRVEEYTRVRN